MAEAHASNGSPNTSQEKRAIEIMISADKKAFVQDKDVGLYNGFIEGEVFIVITFRPEDGASVGVNALMIQQWHEEARAIIDYLRLEVGEDCDTLEGAYAGAVGDIHLAFSSTRLTRNDYHFSPDN